MFGSVEAFKVSRHKNSVKYAVVMLILSNFSKVRHGLELATQATQNSKFQDWWWKLQMGKCYYRLSMFRYI